MPIRALRSFTSSDRFAEVLFVVLSIFLFAKVPGILLFPFAVALVAIPLVLVYALSVTKWTFPAKAIAVLAAMLLELWTLALLSFAYAFAYGKPLFAPFG